VPEHTIEELGAELIEPMAAHIVGGRHHEHAATDLDHVHTVGQDLLDIEDVLEAAAVDQSVEGAVQGFGNGRVQIMDDIDPPVVRVVDRLKALGAEEGGGKIVCEPVRGKA
jgi:hypothetical protein